MGSQACVLDAYASGNDLEHRHVAQLPVAASGGPFECEVMSLSESVCYYEYHDMIT